MKLHRLAAARARASVCVSRSQFERVGLAGTVIYNPVPALEEGTGDPDGDIVAFAGRLVREKGLDLLLEALRSTPEARLLVAGDGPLRGEWERLADDLGVARRTSFLGDIPADPVAALYARSTVVCVPSVWGEPFGYSAAEAMAVGRAVVALPTGSLPELLTGGRGFLANEASSSALSTALRDALADPAGRRRAGVAAREFAMREFASDVVGRRYLQTYER